MENLNMAVTSCGDLERLAAAAATMVYSPDSLQVASQHVPNNSNSNILIHQGNQVTNALPTGIVSHYPLESFDISKNNQYASMRLSDIQHKPLFEQNRPNQIFNQQQIIIDSQTIQEGRIEQPHYALFDQGHSGNVMLSRGQVLKENIISTKTLSVSQGASGIHYFPVYTRNISQIPDTLAIAVSQAESADINSSSENAQSVIHFVSQPNSVLNHSTSHSNMTLGTPSEEQQQISDSSDLNENSNNIPEESHSIKESSINKEKNSDDGSHEVDNSIVDSSKIPEHVEINGKKYLLCPICDEKFLRKYDFKRHRVSHTEEKRGSLSLETKVDIIKRIRNGEKRVNLAIEFNVGRSTLSFLMKNADKFLGVLQKGQFHPESKRLRGAMREDVEAALYQWYKQASKAGKFVSGPILCRKARDFATKLGYQEFKATHGWFDRFKRRKDIVLTRTKSQKNSEMRNEEFQSDFTDVILPNLLVDYESNDVFYASEIGLLYKVCPSQASKFKGIRCASGTNSKKRITVLMCTNMTGSEKFPLLVIGKPKKPKCFRNVKSLPVQYLSNENSWMTLDNFTAWLGDLDNWFSQQNRKVLLVVSNMPVHPKESKLNAVKVVVSPSNFVGPSKLGIAQALKRNYRRSLLEALLAQVEVCVKLKKRRKKLLLKENILTCLHKLSASWHAVSDVTINNSFQRSTLGKYSLWTMNLIPETSFGTENLDLIHQLKFHGIKFPEAFTFDDYVSFDDDVKVCYYMDDDDIISSITGADAEFFESDEDNKEEEEEGESSLNGEDPFDDLENLCPSISEVESNLQIIKDHVSHHLKGVHEVTGVLNHLEYLLTKTRDYTSELGGPLENEQELQEEEKDGFS